MRNPNRYAFGATIVAALALGACATDPQDPKTAHDMGHGLNETYDATLDQAWDAAHAALRWNKVGSLHDDPSHAYVMTREEPSQADFDAKIGVWLTAESPTRTKVSVVVLNMHRKGLGDAMSGPNERGVQNDIKLAVSKLKEGVALGTDRP